MTAATVEPSVPQDGARRLTADVEIRASVKLHIVGFGIGESVYLNKLAVWL